MSNEVECDCGRKWDINDPSLVAHMKMTGHTIMGVSNATITYLHKGNIKDNELTFSGERTIGPLTNEQREILFGKVPNPLTDSSESEPIVHKWAEPVRRGQWMQTFTNRAFWPLDPRASEVFIEDIAHSLSNQCRFAGHCKIFYGVGEHSVRVSDLLLDLHEDPELAFAGLLHDAAEAYLVDLPRPVKRHMSEYAPIEEAVTKVIWEKFHIEVACDDPRIKEADEILLATEKRDLMGPAPMNWGLSAEPLGEKILAMDPAIVERWFLDKFKALSTRRK